MSVRRFACVAVLVLAAPAVLAADGLPGADGPDITDLASGGTTAGGTGENGDLPDGNGGTGGNGGNVTLSISTDDVGPLAEIWSQGGTGGDAGYFGVGGTGGRGGDIDFRESAGTQSAGDLSLHSRGGTGGNGGPGGDDGGKGGAGGTITAVIEGDHTDQQIYVVSLGGTAGYRWCVHCQPYAAGGDTGNVSVDFSGKAKRLSLSSTSGYGGTLGQSGDVTLTLSGEVHEVSLYSGDSQGNPSTGNVTVTLKNGASVSGAIKVEAANQAELIFAFEFATQGDLDAVRAQFGTPAAAPAGGTILVGSKSYTWEGFTSLTDALKLLAAENPDVPISVIVHSSPDYTYVPNFGAGHGTLMGKARPLQKLFRGNAPGKTAPARAKAPAIVGKLRCDNRKVTVFQRDDSSLAINIRVDDKAYAVGMLDGGSFAPASGSRWVATLDGNLVKVSERGGELVATCRL